ncbi:mpv17-like protein 2 [Galendromus occidentalis]|uniref:Mpv17-like protein 2 n=1 Tax=Galendromus occidentalis TaxID=34638 RepID=A0AAJ7SJH4_9ACAR|nr:mpv17-like protein 2 [Galendromus occidentalis]
MLSRFTRRAFDEYLLFTNFALGSTFMLGGDILAQKVTRDGPHDWQRSKNMAIMGTGFGIMGHHWYKFLDKRFPGKSLQMVRNKLLCECAATPAFAGYTFIAFGKLQGKSMTECGRDFREKIKFICVADWFVYVPAQAINFYFLPPKFRFLFVCGLSVIYDMFLAWLLTKEFQPIESKASVEEPKKGR